ncbi:MAG: histidine kinase [Oscillospiraceae bacterium]|nr:histidine kinase [Oscillospiraceae bacterium]
MRTPYLPYAFTEGFCILFSVIILLRLPRAGAGGREIPIFKKMILAFIAVNAADAVWALSVDGLLRMSSRMTGILNAAALAAVAVGCYCWFRFVEVRIAPSGEWSRRAELLAVTPAFILCALDFVSAFTGWVFYVDAAGAVQSGAQFWVQSVGTYLYLIAAAAHALWAGIRDRQKEKRSEYLSYVGFMAVCFGTVAVEDYFPTVPLLELGIFAMIQVIFLTLYIDRAYVLAKKERELSESRVEIMLSQIQPHFIYNALAVIQDMCHGKAPEAEQMTYEFAKFLRCNIDALGRKDTVPFSEELEHTRYYLQMEQKRFGADMLRVETDIRALDFRIPVLTLQPLAENAVRFGVMKHSGGGTVSISSRETPDAFVVRVQDDGGGFDPAEPPKDGRVHVGIANVRERLEQMCGGSLTIDSSPGKGTAAIIFIPKTGPSGAQQG